MGAIRLFIRICLACLIAAILLATILALFNREPNYAGKPFSYWLDQIPCTVIRPNGSVSMMYPEVYSTRAEAEANQKQNVERAQKGLRAVSQVGGECLPLLLRRLRSKDSP